MTGKQESEIMTIPEVADYMGISTKTAFRLAKAKMIPGKKVGGRWFISRAALKKFLGVPVERSIPQKGKPKATSPRRPGR